MLKGKKITLKPILPKDKDSFFEIATKSYGSQFWYDDTEKEKQSRTAFFKDWTKEYFDINKPKKGQCFWIILNGKTIGVITHSEIDRSQKTEIDIIIAEEKNTSKGYGADALYALSKYLFEEQNVNRIWLEVRENNPRALKCYLKAGFKREGILKESDLFKGKYVDCIILGLLRKEFNKT